jgi:predicted alpha/beta hydrolase family esterase
MRTQIIFIHGGNTFRSKKEFIKFLKTRKISLDKKIKWNDDYLDKHLGNDFEIIRLSMPLKDDAKYKEWKIYFERFFPHLRDNIILIGNSLGGIFLAKYLSENKFPKKILSTYLICPPFDDTIKGEDLVGGFELNRDLSRLDNSSKNLYLMFSKNDNIVPVSHAQKYKRKLKNAKIIIFDDKNGHFFISKFPEIIKMIKKDNS